MGLKIHLIHMTIHKNNFQVQIGMLKENASKADKKHYRPRLVFRNLFSKTFNVNVSFSFFLSFSEQRSNLGASRFRTWGCLCSVQGKTEAALSSPLMAKHANGKTEQLLARWNIIEHFQSGKGFFPVNYRTRPFRRFRVGIQDERH